MTTFDPDHKLTKLDPAKLRPKSGFRPRLFAMMMAQGNDTQDAYLVPYKRLLLGNLHGTIMEIGPGSGPNLAYYARDVQWIGVEPNLHMHSYLRATAAKQNRAIDLRTGYAEALPAEDESMDAVVSTLVLCSVHDLDASLAEIRRVLKPGGKFVFIEHVAAETGTGLRQMQNFVRPVWRAVADGCLPNREIGKHLQQAGFTELKIEQFDVAVPVVKPHIAGYGVK